MRSEWQKIERTCVACCALFVTLGGIFGCSRGEPGRIRIDKAGAIGIYEAPFKNGKERLELKGDGSYVQNFLSSTRPFQHTGKWHIDNHIFGGSDIVLSNANVGEEDETRGLDVGDCRLNVHDHAGKIALARNEVMDLYYERVQ